MTSNHFFFFFLQEGNPATVWYSTSDSLLFVLELPKTCFSVQLLRKLLQKTKQMLDFTTSERIYCKLLPLYSNCKKRPHSITSLLKKTQQFLEYLWRPLICQGKLKVCKACPAKAHCCKPYANQSNKFMETQSETLKG